MNRGDDGHAGHAGGDRGGGVAGDGGDGGHVLAAGGRGGAGDNRVGGDVGDTRGGGDTQGGGDARDGRGSGDGWISTSVPYLAPQPGGAPGDVWGEEAAAKGRRGTQCIVHAGEVPASEEVSGLLGVAEGEAVVVRRRVIELDGEPRELTDTYYPVHIAGGTGLADVAKIPGGAVTLLARLGHVGVRVREDVTAALPSAAEQQALRIGPDTPVLRLTRLTLDAGDRPLQADLMTMPAQGQRLRYELRIG